MNFLKGLLGKAGVVVAAVLALIAAVYVGTTMLHDSDPETFGFLSAPFRILLCVVLLLAAAFGAALVRMQMVTRSLLIEKTLQQAGRDAVESARPDQRGGAEAVEQRFNEGLAALKSSRFDKVGLSALPWYVIIGPPGSGKTTMLHESGLTFLLDHKRGIRGIGGTRNCDWFFTQEGILLDTAGRYTTEVEDHDEWLGFLRLLKQARRGKALNGVIVAMSVGDLVLARPDEVDAHAERVRERIDELSRELELALPVYLLFTKTDLVEGFVEFFGGLDRTERAQVFGMTFDAHADVTTLPFAAELERIEQRLESRRSRLLALDMPLRRQQRIYSFPIQFRDLRSRLLRFLEMVVQPNPYHDPARLRGVYFTSGTQEGNPIDQVMTRMRAELGLPAVADDGVREDVPSQAYFIESMVREIVFEDRDLVSDSATAIARARHRRLAAIAASVALALLAGIVSWRSYAGLDAEAVAIESVVPAAMKTVTAADVDPASPAALDALDVLDSATTTAHIVGDGRDLQASLRSTSQRFALDTLWPTLFDRGIRFVDGKLDACKVELATATREGLENGKSRVADSVAPQLGEAKAMLDALERLGRGEASFVPALGAGLQIDGDRSIQRINARLAAALAAHRTQNPAFDGTSLLALSGPSGARFDATFAAKGSRIAELGREVDIFGVTIKPDPGDPGTKRTTRDEARIELGKDASASWQNVTVAFDRATTNQDGAARRPADVLAELTTSLDASAADHPLLDHWTKCVSAAFEITRESPLGITEGTQVASRRGAPQVPPDQPQRVTLLFEQVRRARDLAREPAKAFAIADGPSPVREFLVQLADVRKHALLAPPTKDEQCAYPAGWPAYQDYVVNGATRILDRIEQELLAAAVDHVDAQWQPLSTRLGQAFARYPFERSAPIDDNLSLDEFTALFAPSGQVAGFAATLAQLDANGLGGTLRLVRSQELKALFALQERIARTFFSDGGKRPFVLFVLEAASISQDVVFTDPTRALQHVDVEIGAASWKTSSSPEGKRRPLRWDSTADRARIEFRPLRSGATTSRDSGAIVAISKGPWSLFRLVDDKRWAEGNDLAHEIDSDASDRGVFAFDVPGTEPTATWTLRIDSKGGKADELVEVENPLRNAYFDRPSLPTHPVRGEK